MVVGYNAQVRKLKIVNVHGVAFLNHLFNELIDNAVAFPAAWASDHHSAFHRVYDVDKTVVPLLVMIKSSVEIYRILVLNQAGFLHERLILIIEYILQHIILQKTTDSHSCSEQENVSRNQRGDIKERGYGNRNCDLEQNPTTKKKHDSSDGKNCDEPSGYMCVFSSACAQTRK